MSDLFGFGGFIDKLLETSDKEFYKGVASEYYRYCPGGYTEFYKKLKPYAIDGHLGAFKAINLLYECKLITLNDDDFLQFNAVFPGYYTHHVKRIEAKNNDSLLDKIISRLEDIINKKFESLEKNLKLEMQFMPGSVGYHEAKQEFDTIAGIKNKN